MAIPTGLIAPKPLSVSVRSIVGAWRTRGLILLVNPKDDAGLVLMHAPIMVIQVLREIRVMAEPPERLLGEDHELESLVPQVFELFDPAGTFFGLVVEQRPHPSSFQFQEGLPRLVANDDYRRLLWHRFAHRRAVLSHGQSCRVRLRRAVAQVGE